MMTTEDILSKLLLHNNNDWEIENVTCDDSTEEIDIMLKYRYDTIKVEKKEFPIFDFRHKRSWRHLDMWHSTRPSLRLVFLVTMMAKRSRVSLSPGHYQTPGCLG
ncbi:hypothetical protein [Prevotella pallens]|uniref:hypothetical protein n=1 Tax=Prevotella pallens TaxID=60133 RepID=UPI00352FA9CB